MLKGAWQDADPLIKLIIFIGVVLFSAGLFSIGGIALTAWLTQTDIASISNAFTQLDDTHSVTILKFLQFISQIGMMLAPTLLCAYLFAASPLEFLSLNRSRKFSLYFMVFFMMLCAAPLINYLVELNSLLKLPSFLSSLEAKMISMEEQASKLTDAFLLMRTKKDLLINILLIGVLPAIGEELLFRGVLQKLLKEMIGNIHVCILLVSVLFSAIHMQFYGFLPRMMLGMFFGYLLEWSGSLWLPIVAHFINNASAVIFSWFVQHQVIDFNPDTLGTEAGHGWMVFLSLALFASGLFFFWKSRIMKKPPSFVQ
jgi:membrane protease YdiL (CAAX protease family)